MLLCPFVVCEHLHPGAHYLKILWPHGCSSLSSSSLGGERGVTHGSWGRVRFYLFWFSRGPLNKRTKHLFGECKICPRRSFNRLRAIDMAKKHTHKKNICVSYCVLHWCVKTGQLEPYPRPYSHSVFTNTERGHNQRSCWPRPTSPLMIIETHCLRKCVSFA